MQFHFTEEQEQFREMTRRFLAAASPTTAVRQQMESQQGFDPLVWRRLSAELALPGISVPEAYGGAGFGLVELGIAMEEMGRALLCSPFFASAVLAAKALEHVASEAQKVDLLPAIASGECIATLAVTEPQGSPRLADVQMCAAADGNGYRLNGTKKFVVDGCNAHLMLVVARQIGTSGLDGLSLFAVAHDAAGLQIRDLQVLDPTRRQAEAVFADVSATLLGSAGGAAAGLQRALDLAAIALANEMVGGADLLVEQSVAYTKLRVQFGRPIGSFQAIKHKCAEMLLSVELAKSAAYAAAQAADGESADIARMASLAKAAASEAYLAAGLDAIQMHGGVGFTWENDTHLWFKRAKSSEVMLGDPTYHRARMIEEMVQQERVA